MGVTHVNSLSFRQIWIYSLKLDGRAKIGVDALGKQQVIMLQRECRLQNVYEVTAKGDRSLIAPSQTYEPDFYQCTCISVRDWKIHLFKI